MTKHYHIRITDCSKNKGMWYWNKINSEHDATLGVTSSDIAVFIVGGGKKVYPEDCVVLKEWME